MDKSLEEHKITANKKIGNFECIMHAGLRNDISSRSFDTATKLYISKITYHHTAWFPTWIAKLQAGLNQEELGTSIGKLDPLSRIHKPLTERLLKRKLGCLSIFDFQIRF